MIDRWRKFLRLSSSARKLFFQALFLLPLMSLALRLLSFKSIQSSLANLARVNNTQTEQLVKSYREISVTAMMVKAAAYHGVYHANCLQQSLVLWWLLRRQGIESELRIGVHKTGGWLEAHAWVERLGQALNESDDVHQRFTAFDRSIVRGEVNLSERHCRYL